MHKILIFGNSGSGKSTLAMQLARQHDIPHLDLDTISWSSPGVRKTLDESRKEIQAFLEQHPAWVIEGCYGRLLEAVAGQCSQMLFLNPGIDACLANNLRRPWEPHKYPSKAAQDKNLAMLQDWVREYVTRQDEYSLAYHRRLFEHFTGSKQELTEMLELKYS